MKPGHSVLWLSMAAALALAPMMADAAQISTATLAQFSTAEAPRVISTINDHAVSALPGTHLEFIGKLAPAAAVSTATTMNHLQLVLKRSRSREAALQRLLSAQHDPASPLYRHWLTPKQYGETFGVSDQDIAAVKSWLKTQGFKVNGVYPNKMQIDFSGTVQQVNAAFHTQENVYQTLDGAHYASARNVSVPAALAPVITGVLGLNSFRPHPMRVPTKVAKRDKNSKLFAYQQGTSSSTADALQFTNGARGLVPNDMTKIYNVDALRDRANKPVTGAGITIAVVEDDDMVPADWTNFTSQFNLARYGGTFTQSQPDAGLGNCYDPQVIYGQLDDDGETLLDAEWSTAIAPGAHIWVATCADANTAGEEATSNFFGGVYIAADNLINLTSGRPDIISASYGYGEGYTDAASKSAIDEMWGQADAEGISVFVSSGDSGSNPSFNGSIIQGVGVDANSLATSSHVTAVGGTDFADVLDGTAKKYFSTNYLDSTWGTAKSYVPEIPWNESCGNEVAAQSNGFDSTLAFCKFLLKWDPDGYYVTSEAGSGGPSSVDIKPAWQRLVTGAARDQSRDVPDVALFAGSYGGSSWVVTCTADYPCTPNWSGSIALSGGTSLASPMFAGIQALIDQSMVYAGQPADQGDAAPTLYALASAEYGSKASQAPASLAACNADHGTKGTSGCVFHNVTRGSIATQCIYATTPDCYIYGTIKNYAIPVGLTSLSSSKYNATTEAYRAHPGWSFAAGLGSVNAANLVKAWLAFNDLTPFASN